MNPCKQNDIILNFTGAIHNSIRSDVGGTKPKNKEIE
jgi:hypothetical protein